MAPIVARLVISLMVAGGYAANIMVALIRGRKKIKEEQDVRPTPQNNPEKRR